MIPIFLRRTSQVSLARMYPFGNILALTLDVAAYGGSCSVATLNKTSERSRRRSHFSCCRTSRPRSSTQRAQKGILLIKILIGYHNNLFIKTSVTNVTLVDTHHAPSAYQRAVQEQEKHCCLLEYQFLSRLIGILSLMRLQPPNNYSQSSTYQGI